MNELAQFNGPILSLGFSCSPKKFINSIHNGVSHYFDWIGTSAWYINNYFLSDNHSIVAKDLEVQRVHKHKIITHNKYYIRLIHSITYSEVNNKKKIQDVIESFERKRNRFIDTLMDAGKNNKKVCFLRIAEPMDGREISEDKLHYYKKEEETHLAEFQEQIKNKYNIDSKIILFSTTKETQRIGNVLILNTKKNIFFRKADKQITEILNNNQEAVKLLLEN